MIWETADGRRLTVPEITNDHLKNIIRHIGINGTCYPSWVLWKFIAEAVARNIAPIECLGPPVPFRDTDGVLKTLDSSLGKICRGEKSRLTCR